MFNKKRRQLVKGYEKKYHELLERKRNGEDVVEDRLGLLELADRERHVTAKP